MRIACMFEELDPATRKYLEDVRRRKGKGTPGVFLERSDPKPVIALMLGVMIGFGLVAIGFSAEKDPLAIACCQTSGVLIAGWSLFYAVRRWSMGYGTTQCGRFVYFDPCHIFELDAERVTVTSLENVTSVTAKQGAVLFEFNPGRSLISVPKTASYVADYYDAMGQLEGRDDNPARNAAELGAAAKFVVEEDRFPQNITEVKVDLEEMPVAVTKTNKAGAGLFGMLGVVVSAGLLMLVFWSLNSTVGEESAFEKAKSGGVPALRGYLLNPHFKNEKYREEARSEIARAYIPALSLVESAKPPIGPGPGPGFSPTATRDGMKAILESVRSSPTPLVSFSTSEKASAALPVNDVRSNAIKEKVVDSLVQTITPQLIFFADPPKEKPAMISVTYEWVPLKGTLAGKYSVLYSAEFRTDPAGEPVARASWVPTVAHVFTAEEIENTGDNRARIEVAKHIATVLMGEYRAPLPQPVVSGDL